MRPHPFSHAQVLLAATVVATATQAGQDENEPYEVATVCASTTATAVTATTASAVVQDEHEKDKVATIATTTV